MIVVKGIPASEGIAISYTYKYYSRAGIEIPRECKAGEKELRSLVKLLKSIRIT
jgi:hypothetical protein